MFVELGQQTDRQTKKERKGKGKEPETSIERGAVFSRKKQKQGREKRGSTPATICITNDDPWNCHLLSLFLCLFPRSGYLFYFDVIYRHILPVKGKEMSYRRGGRGTPMGIS